MADIIKQEEVIEAKVEKTDDNSVQIVQGNTDVIMIQLLSAINSQMRTMIELIKDQNKK